MADVLLRGDTLCRVLAFLPRREDETVRAVCRGWNEDVRRFRASWLAHGTSKTVHPGAVSYRVLSGGGPSHALPVRPTSPLYRPTRHPPPTSPLYRPTSPLFSPTSPVYDEA